MKINENPNSPKDTIKAADYIVSFIENMGIGHIFLVTGAGSMHLNDAIGRNKNIQYVCTHHEQAAAMAAEAYARVKDSLGVAMVTTGPGGTNAITGLAGAWIDSIPCLFISGQIALKDTIRNTGLRQRGVQEVDIISIVKSLTKYSVMITDVKDIKYHLQKAVYLAKSGRPGPVWLDIPLDVQGSFINVDELNEFKPSAADECHCDSSAKLQEKVYKTLEILKASERPIIWIGNGVRLAGAKSDLKRVLEKLKIPVLTTWSGADLIPDEHELFIGRPGLFGQRAANFAVQNADTIITVGNRLSIPQTGFNFMAFARASKKVFVDIDINELSQKPFKPDIAINSDAKDFLIELDRQLEIFKPNDLRNWIKTCRQWKLRYPLVLPDYLKEKNYVNSYVFVDMLSEELNESDIIVTDMGTSFTTTFQAFKVKNGQRLFTSGGLASMGFGLPGAIGACFANNKKKTICITGEGSFMFNLQEMQTVMHHNLPIKIFLLNNGSYSSIVSMQNSNFLGFHVGADRESGVSFPDLSKVAKGFGFNVEKIRNYTELKDKLRHVLEMPGPVFCELLLSPNEVLSPRLRTKVKPDGSMSQSPLEDMWPFLERGEFRENMIIKPLEE